MIIPLSIALTIFAFAIAIRIKKRFRYDFLNPLLVSVIIILAVLYIFKIPYTEYKHGGDYILFFLSPLTIVLGVTLYRQRAIIISNLIPMLVGITTGVLVSLLSIIFIGKGLGLQTEHIITLIPKSITSPMGISLADIIRGDTTLLIVMIQLAGITGAIFAPYLKHFFPWLDKVALGVGIGTASHAIGTSKALEIGEVEGAVSSTAIGLAGIITVLLVPHIYHLFL